MHSLIMSTQLGWVAAWLLGVAPAVFAAGIFVDDLADTFLVVVGAMERGSKGNRRVDSRDFKC